MHGKRVWMMASLALLCCLWVARANGISDGEQVKFKGLITTRDGDTLTVRTLEVGNVIVVLSDNTSVVQPKGLLKVRKNDMGVTALIPGLKIEVEGIGDARSRVVAKTIKFSKDDLRTAEAIQAGLVPTQQTVQTNQQNISANSEAIAANEAGIASNKEKIEANQQDITAINQRFSDLTEFDTRYTATVFFATGSTKISAKDRQELQDLARSAINLKGYLVQVKGYADSSGSAAMNQKLSMERAQEVVAYLLQTCQIPLRHIVAPGAMGEADPAAPNETKQGRAENRRVEVRVLVNRGLAGGTGN